MRTLLLAAALLATPASADTLIDNVNGLQVDAKGQLQKFTGLWIGNDGKVVKLLGAKDARPKRVAIRINGRGRAMLPGLIDAHGHVTGLGETALTLNLEGTTSLAELQQRLKDYAAAHPGTGWIEGGSWNQERWPTKRFPTAADLDAVVADRPVMLQRIDGHALVANSAAMRAAGVTPQTPVPSGGAIDQGLFVDNAMSLIEAKIPTATSAVRDARLAKSLEILRGYGLTATADMGTLPADWAAMQRAGGRGELTARIMSYGAGMAGATAISANGPTAWLYRDRLKLEGVKLYADGALGSRGAWLKAPYADKPDTSGLRFHTDAEYGALVAEAAKRRYQIATHAIGDAADAQVIAAYEGLAKTYGTDRRWRIEHAQVLDPADIGRLAPAGIIASMQPVHQTSDRKMAEARLDPARLTGAYAWASMLKNGSVLAFGSDVPVESANPFPGLAAAITREGADGQPFGGWQPQERISREAALAGFTTGAAFAGQAEDRIGRLASGYRADFILVDVDPLLSTPGELRATKVIETWVSGKRVFRAK